jgi:hypothetical protein
MQAQNTKVAEVELREFIVNTKGFGAYQDLLKLRRDILAERKEAERQAERDRQTKKEEVVIISAIIFAVVAAISAIYYLGLHLEKW